MIQSVAQVAATAHRARVAARVVDLCCGMGGLSVAARELGMTVVAGVDVNPSAMRTFSRNFPEAKAIKGSVRSGTVQERCRALLDGEGDDLSIVLSGPPCQGFSAAGSRDPKDRRNGVLVAVARAISKIQPDRAASPSARPPGCRASRTPSAFTDHSPTRWSR